MNIGKCCLCAKVGMVLTDEYLDDTDKPRQICNDCACVCWDRGYRPCPKCGIYVPEGKGRNYGWQRWCPEHATTK